MLTHDVKKPQITFSTVITLTLLSWLFIYPEYSRLPGTKPSGAQHLCSDNLLLMRGLGHSKLICEPGVWSRMPSLGLSLTHPVDMIVAWEKLAGMKVVHACHARCLGSLTTLNAIAFDPDSLLYALRCSQ